MVKLLVYKLWDVCTLLSNNKIDYFVHNENATVYYYVILLNWYAENRSFFSLQMPIQVSKQVILNILSFSAVHIPTLWISYEWWNYKYWYEYVNTYLTWKFQIFCNLLTDSYSNILFYILSYLERARTHTKYRHTRIGTNSFYQWRKVVSWLINIDQLHNFIKGILGLREV